MSTGMFRRPGSLSEWMSTLEWFPIDLVCPHCVCRLMSNCDASINHVLDECLHYRGPNFSTELLSWTSQNIGLLNPTTSPSGSPIHSFLPVTILCLLRAVPFHISSRRVPANMSPERESKSMQVYPDSISELKKVILADRTWRKKLL
jgi:hypothetical protein